jgi:hypothetical protein
MGPDAAEVEQQPGAVVEVVGEAGAVGQRQVRNACADPRVRAGQVVAMLGAGDLLDEVGRAVDGAGEVGEHRAQRPRVDRANSPKLLHRRGGRRLLGWAARAGVRLAAHGPRPLREVGRFLGNSPYLMTNEVAPFIAFEPDLAGLAASGVPIVIGGGTDGWAYYPYLGGVAVAERLGVALVEFPGGHVGYTEDPAAFAVILRKTLTELRPDSHL